MSEPFEIRGLPGDIAIHIVPNETGCWEWTGYISDQGYPRTRRPLGHWGWVHRIVCEWAHGPIPDGYEVDHLCRVRHCVNPAHLEAVPPRVNMLRSNHPSAIAVRTGLCKRGHDLAQEAGYLKSGSRYCKECRRQQQREHYALGDWPSRRSSRHRITNGGDAA